MKSLIPKILICLALLVAGAGSMLAGGERMDTRDSKMVTQPMAAPALCDWTGFYVGAHGGYLWGDATALELNDSDGAFPYDFGDTSAFFGGLQAGYNRQFNSWLVVGVEGEFSGTTFDEDASLDNVNNSGLDRANLRNYWTGTFAGRVGISLLQNKLLIYGKGGFAVGYFNLQTTEDPQGGGPDEFDSNRVIAAGLVGGGIEYAINCHWSAKLEYDHIFFGSEPFAGAETNNTAEKALRSGGDQDRIKLGINYRFGGDENRTMGAVQRVDGKDAKVMSQPMMAPPCDWTGWYAGLHGGYVWGEASAIELNDSFPSAYDFGNNGGFYGGLQFGYNRQLTSLFVLGAEAEFSGTTLDNSAPNFKLSRQSTPEPGSLANPWTGTLAAKAGVAFWQNKMLLYGKGGVAVGQFDLSTNQGGGDIFDHSLAAVAPLAGVGLEYAFTCHWSAKLEYDHFFFGSQPIGSSETNQHQEKAYRVGGDQNVVQAGINYKF